MSLTKKILLPGTVLLTCVGAVLTNSSAMGLCTHDQYSCRDWLNDIGDPLMYGMGALTIVFLLLLLVPKAWRAWKKFAVWYLPLALFLFIFSRDPGAGDLFSPYPEQIYQWTASTYIALSILVIVASRIQQKAQGATDEAGPLIKNRIFQVVWYLYLAWLLWNAIRFLH